MQPYISHTTPFQLYRPDSVAAAVSESNSVTSGWRGRRIHIFNQSSRDEQMCQSCQCSGPRVNLVCIMLSWSLILGAEFQTVTCAHKRKYQELVKNYHSSIAWAKTTSIAYKRDWLDTVGAKDGHIQFHGHLRNRLSYMHMQWSRDLHAMIKGKWIR